VPWEALLRGWVVAIAVLGLTLPAAPDAGAAKRGSRDQADGPRGKVRQLRGAMLTPNWSVDGSPFLFNEAQQRTELENVCVMGGNLVRFHVDWSQLEPAGLDPSYLARMDQVLSWAAACRIRVILNLVGSPCWAIQPTPCRGSTWIFTPPRPGSFETVARFLLSRYPRLYAIEVWNEPNWSFWNGTPAEYAALVNEAVTARNALGSSTKVLAGALLMDAISYPGAIGYLEALYQAGMRGHDGISIHPYSAGCWPACGAFVDPARPRSPFRVAIKGTRRVMIRYGDPGGIYLTEFGFATCPALPGCVAEATAARWLASSFQVAAGYRYVHGLTAFSMRDFAAPSDLDPPWDLRSGILRHDLTPKPAYRRLRSVLWRLERRRVGRRHRGRGYR
jgi:hypothetical protein